MIFRVVPLGLLVLSLLAGCTIVHSEKRPATDLSKFKHVFVERRLSDDHGIDRLIVGELRKRGYDSSTGPLTMLPDNADAVIIYEDEWTFDFTTHMTMLEIRVRPADKAQAIATGRYFQRWISSKSPAKIVGEVMNSLFPAHSAGSGTAVGK